MDVEHLLSAIPVTDLQRSREWYVRLLGREPDNMPMDTLVEWNVTGTGWLQVFVDPDNAGGSFVNLAVRDLDEARSRLDARGLAPGEVQEVNRGVQLCPLDDPDGNRVTLVGHFRVHY